MAALASRQFGYPLPFRGQVRRVQCPLPCCPPMVLLSRRLPSLGRVSMGSIPRRQQYYEGATTPRSAWPWRSWCSRPGSTPISSVRARRSAPSRAENPRGPGPFGHPAVLVSGLSSRGRKRVLPGSQAILPIPLPSSRTPVGPPLESHYSRQVLPPQRRKRGLRRLERFRGLPLGFSIRCLRFKR